LVIEEKSIKDSGSRKAIRIKMKRRISDIPKSDRPREKMQAKGPAALSDHELLAILLGSGTKGSDVMTVAVRILKVLDGNKELSLEDLQKIEGVGPAKATLIAAALEFARRRIRPEGLKITFPADVLPLIQHYGDRKQEHFICVSINGANEVIKSRVVSVGLVNKTQVHPREVFADPITDRASAIIVAHNHPSGTLNPSAEDKEITGQLKASGEVLGIRLLDHIIFNQRGYYSFLEHGKF
jgi:DNA repair protein RadC